MLSLGVNRRRKIIVALRLVIGIGLAISLIHVTLKFTGGNPWKLIKQGRPDLLLLALLFQGLIACIASYRWNLLLRVQGVRLRYLDVIRLTLIGVFCGLALPGSVSGDLAKMSFVCRATKDRKVEAALTVMLDRAFGLFGLTIVGGIVILFSLPFLFDLGKEYRPIQIAACIVGLGSIGGMVLVGLLKWRQIIMRFPWFVWIVNFCARVLPVSIVSHLERLINALVVYRRNLWTILAVIVISIIVHSCLAINLFFVGASVGEDALHLRDYFLACQVANAVAALPLTPGGIGTRDATIAMFFCAAHASTDKAGVIPVIMTLILVFWGLIGGVIFVSSKSSMIMFRPRTRNIPSNAEPASTRSELK